MNKLDSVSWEWHELTGADRGTDIEFELVEDGEFRNHGIACQVKGSSNLVRRNGENLFDLEVKTVNYGLSASRAFLLVIVDLETEKAYYLALQDYFIAHPEEHDRLVKNKSTIRLPVPERQEFCRANNGSIVSLATKTYIGGPGRQLKVAE